MHSMGKNCAVILVVLLGCIAGVRTERVQAADGAPVLEPAVWGPYAKLVGRSWKYESNEVLKTWRWDNGKVLEWGGCDNKCSQENPITIERGNAPGELVRTQRSDIGHIWRGSVANDGSILFVRDGLLKMPFRVRMDGDNRLVWEWVKLKAGQAVPTKYVDRLTAAQPLTVPQPPESDARPSPPQVAVATGGDDKPPGQSEASLAQGVAVAAADLPRLGVGSKISSTLDERNSVDFDGTRFIDYTLQPVPGKKLRVVVASDDFMPIVMVGQRALDNSLDIAAYSTGMLDGGGGDTAEIALPQGKSFDTVRVAAIGQRKNGQYSVSVETGQSTRSASVLNSIEPALLQELAAAHKTLGMLVSQRGLKAAMIRNDADSMPRTPILGYDGSRCTSLFRTDAGYLKIDWGQVGDVLYGTTRDDNYMVAIIARSGGNDGYTLLVANEAMTREVAQLMNLTRAACLQRPATD